MFDDQEDATEIGKLRARVHEQKEFLRELEEEMQQYNYTGSLDYWISKIVTFLKNTQQ